MIDYAAAAYGGKQQKPRYKVKQNPIRTGGAIGSPTAPQPNQPGLYDPSDNPIYPGGATGVENDFDLRNSFAGDAFQGWMNSQIANWQQQNQSRTIDYQNRYDANQAAWNANTNAQLGAYNNQVTAEMARWNAQNSANLSAYNTALQSNAGIRQTASGLATRAQMQDAERAMNPARGYAQRQMEQGDLTDEQEAQIIAQNREAVGANTRAMAGDYSNALRSRGGSVDPTALAAMGMRGQFQAAGAAGRAYTDLAQSEGEARRSGLNTYSGISQAIAELRARATQEGALSQLQDVPDYNPGSGPVIPNAPTFEGGPEVPNAPVYDEYQFDQDDALAWYDRWRNATRGPDDAPNNTTQRRNPGGGAVGGPVWNQPSYSSTTSRRYY